MTDTWTCQRCGGLVVGPDDCPCDAFADTVRPQVAKLPTEREYLERLRATVDAAECDMERAPDMYNYREKGEAVADAYERALSALHDLSHEISCLLEEATEG